MIWVEKFFEVPWFVNQSLWFPPLCTVFELMNKNIYCNLEVISNTMFQTRIHNLTRLSMRYSVRHSLTAFNCHMMNILHLCHTTLEVIANDSFAAFFKLRLYQWSTSKECPSFIASTNMAAVSRPTSQMGKMLFHHILHLERLQSSGKKCSLTIETDEPASFLL